MIIVLLGLELVTGSFALVPLARLEGKSTWGAVIANWSWVFSAICSAALPMAVCSRYRPDQHGHSWHRPASRRALSQVAEAKTIANEAIGAAGMVSVFVKAILCNWLVCLGVVLAMTSSSTVGKIAATWMPIFLFFALGFEHAVVNMFIIPTGMLLGAKVTVYDGGCGTRSRSRSAILSADSLFTGLALYSTFKPADQAIPSTRRRAGSGRITVRRPS